MNRNTRTLLIDQAEAALRCWHGDDMTREQATALLPSWRWVVGLDDDMRAEVLDRFPSAEPPSVPGLDWLPAGTCPSMFQDRNEPIYLYPCRQGEGHEGKHYSRDRLHSWTDAEQYNADAAVLVAEAVAVLDEPARHRSLSEKIEAANAEAAKFNAEFPPGTPVEYWSGAREGNGKIGHTEGEAFSSSSGQAVVFLDNASSYHALSHVRPLTAEQVAP